MSGRTLRAITGLGIALMVAAVALGIAAIWITGPNSGRTAGTAALVFLLGLAIAAISDIARAAR